MTTCRYSFRFSFVYFSIVDNAQVSAKHVERDVFCDEPFDIKRTVEFTFPLPKGFVLIEIDVGSHLRDAREVVVFTEKGIFFEVSSSHSSLQF